MASKKTSAPGKPETLLVELLTEELPPKALQHLSQRFCDALVTGLGSLFPHPHAVAPDCFATPRRLAVSIHGVLDKAVDVHNETTGPPISAGPDAAKGFARKCGVSVESLTKHQTSKGEVWLARYTVAGAKLDEVLAQKVDAALKTLPVPKLMRWGDGEAQFARPVHGLVMMHGTRIVPGSVLGLESSNQTLGHRFLGSGRITIKHAGDYEQALLKGMVVAGYETRQEIIINKINKLCGSSATPVASGALYGEIAALTEAPEVYAGEFSREFLEVPEECLILSMQQHQKYVPLRDKATGRLLPRFLFVSNIAASTPREIVHGNERVLRARLADAKFFHDQDRKTRLEARVPKLGSVVYHNKLGSQLERVERIRKLSGTIARELKADAALAGRAAWLSKADLLTDMVGEFPELQGVMGRYYALHDGEPQEVAAAIEQHYHPRFAGDELPEEKTAVTVALADKLDALAGLFGIGQAPTGDKDPFGLRRAALGVIRILVERDLPLSVHDLINEAFAVYDGRIGGAHTDLETFIRDRLSGYLRDCGYSALEVDSVLSVGHARINDTVRQLEAVRAFNRLPEAESLAAANKRVVNILKQAAARGESFADATSEMLKEAAERALFDALRTTSRQAMELFNRGDYTGYLKSFAVLKSPVDAFFDSVMVMAEDSALRQNRLALLADLRKEMNRVADISKLAA